MSCTLHSYPGCPCQNLFCIRTVMRAGPTCMKLGPECYCSGGDVHKNLSFSHACPRAPLRPLSPSVPTRGFAGTFLGTWAWSSRTHPPAHSPKHSAGQFGPHLHRHFCGHLCGHSCLHYLPGASRLLLQVPGRGRAPCTHPFIPPGTCGHSVHHGAPFGQFGALPPQMTCMEAHGGNNVHPQWSYQAGAHVMGDMEIRYRHAPLHRHLG